MDMNWKPKEDDRERLGKWYNVKDSLIPEGAFITPPKFRVPPRNRAKSYGESLAKKESTNA